MATIHEADDLTTSDLSSPEPPGVGGEGTITSVEELTKEISFSEDP